MQSIIYRTLYYVIVPGNWGSWGSWSHCNEACGGGIRNRTRLCDDPSPQYGGADCTRNATLVDIGLSSRMQKQLENKQCNSEHCPSKG